MEYSKINFDALVTPSEKISNRFYLTNQDKPRVTNLEIFQDIQKIQHSIIEINDDAVQCLNNENYSQSFKLLKNAQRLIEIIANLDQDVDLNLIIMVLYNFSSYYQKISDQSECVNYLEATLYNVNNKWARILNNQLYPSFISNINNSKLAQICKINKIMWQTKINLQLCAMNSQLNNHHMAHKNAKLAACNAQSLIIETKNLITFLKKNHLFEKKLKISKKDEVTTEDSDNKTRQISLNDSDTSSRNLNNIEKKMTKDDIKEKDKLQSKLNSNDCYDLAEQTIKENEPILDEVLKMISDASQSENSIKISSPRKIQLTMSKIDEMKANLKFKRKPRSVLGLKTNEDWVSETNIGNIMHITPVLNEEFQMPETNVAEITRNSIYEKIIYLIISYFSLATEYRFLSENGGDKINKLESEHWHKLGVEIACTFLPSECPLVNHLISSYEKHYSLAQQIILEDENSEEQEFLMPCMRLSESIEDLNEFSNKPENHVNTTFDENKASEYPKINLNQNLDLKLKAVKLKGKKIDIKESQPRAISSKKGYKLTKIVPKICANLHSNSKVKLGGKNSTPIHLTFHGDTDKPLTHRINISTKSKMVKIKEVVLSSK